MTWHDLQEAIRLVDRTRPDSLSFYLSDAYRALHKTASQLVVALRESWELRDAMKKKAGEPALPSAKCGRCGRDIKTEELLALAPEVDGECYWFTATCMVCLEAEKTE